jgi:hypothetical protein
MDKLPGISDIWPFYPSDKKGKRPAKKGPIKKHIQENPNTENYNDLEKKFDKIADEKQSDENIVSSVNKLKNMKG